MASVDKVILFLGQTFTGHTHDYTMLKHEFPPDKPWFDELTLMVDLGYQGIRSDYGSETIQLPHKKPRRSKRHPVTALSDEQKRDNRALSQIRILVEHAICGLKRYNILVHRFRNHTPSLGDHVAAIAAALWNFNLSY